MNWLLVGSLMASLSIGAPEDYSGDLGGPVHTDEEMILGADLMDHPELWRGATVADHGGLEWNY